MEMFVSKLINMTGREHNTEIVTYGLYAIIDGLETIIVIMLLGAVIGKLNCSLIYLLMSFVGTGTMGMDALSSLARYCAGGTLYAELQMYSAPGVLPQYRYIWSFAALSGSYYGPYCTPA